MRNMGLSGVHVFARHRTHGRLSASMSVSGSYVLWHIPQKHIFTWTLLMHSCLKLTGTSAVHYTLQMPWHAL